MLVMVVVVLVLATSSVVLGQANQCAYVPPKEFKPIECRAVVGDRPFLVPRALNLTKELVIQTAREGAYGLSLQSNECRKAGVRFLCLSVFQPCFMTPFSPVLPNFFVLPLPSPPCRADCEAFASACSDVIKAGLLPAPNCTAMSDAGPPFDAPFPLYPNQSVAYSLNGGAITANVPCREARDQSLPDPEECPPPTRLNDYLHHLPKCTVPCKVFYTHSQKQTIVILNLVLCWVSAFFDVFILIGFVRVPELRTFPAHLIAGTLFSNMIRSIGIGILGFVKGSDVVCRNEFEFATTYDPACGASLMLEALTGYISMSYCGMLFCLIALIIYFGVHPRTIAKFCIPVHVLALTIPIVSFIVVFALDGGIGPPTLIVFCSVVFDHGLFWICLFAGLVFYITFGAVASIFVIAGLLGKHQERKSQFTRNFPFLLFITAYLLTTVVFCSFAVYSFAQLDTLEQGVIDFIQCSVTTRFNDIDAFEKCGLKNPPNFGFLVFFIIIFQGSDIWLALSLSFHRKLRMAWLEILGLRKKAGQVTVRPSNITNSKSKDNVWTNSASGGESNTNSS